MEPASIIIFIGLFFLSAFFSGTEIALMSLAPHTIDSFIKQRKSGAKSLKKIKKNTDRLLITILIGNNLVNVTAASFATKISIDIANAAGWEQGIAIGISTGIITLLLLLFGEIFPKALATRHAEYISLRVAKIYVILNKILLPIVICIEYAMHIFKKQKGKKKVTDEEVESFIEMSNKEGVFEKGEYEKIKNMLDFYEITAQEIMIPRTKIDAMIDTLTINEAIEKMFQLSHSRIPVYQSHIDGIERFVRLKELLAIQKSGQGTLQLKQISLTPIIKVPLTKPIHKILDEFKKTRNHIAVVIDEYGGVAGILTLEDIIEEVFGEIHDETDKELLPSKKIGDDYYFQSYVMFDDVLGAFELQFHDIAFPQDKFSGETLSYFIISHLGRFPEAKEKIYLPILRQDDDEKDRTLVLEVTHIHKNTLGEIKVGIVTT